MVACGDGATGPIDFANLAIERVSPTESFECRPAQPFGTLTVRVVRVEPLPNGATTSAPVPEVPVMFKAPPTFTVAPATTTTDDEGNASAQLTCGQTVGTFGVVAEVPGEAPGSVAATYSFGANVLPGPAARLATIIPDSQPGGFFQKLFIGIKALDRFGNQTDAPATSWQVSSGGGLLQTASHPKTGAWTFHNEWTLGPGSGLQTVVVTGTDPAVEPLTLHAFVIAPDVSVTPEVRVLSAEAGQAITPNPRARAVAAGGIGVPNVTIRFPPVSAGSEGSITCVPAPGFATTSYGVLTDAQGHAELRCAFPAIATRVDFDSGGTGNVRYTTLRGQTVEWIIAATPAPPVSIVTHRGNDQAGFVGQPLPSGLQILVLDEFGNRRQDDFVTWTVTSGGGSVSAGARASDTAYWTLGPSVGVQTVTVSVNAAPGIMATFTATAFAAP